MFNKTSVEREGVPPSQQPPRLGRFRAAFLAWLGTSGAGACFGCVLGKGDWFGFLFGTLVAGLLGGLCYAFVAFLTWRLRLERLQLFLVLVSGALTGVATAATLYPVGDCFYCQERLWLSFRQAAVLAAVLGGLGGGLGGYFSPKGS
jgi:hypothetical protein